MSTDDRLERLEQRVAVLEALARAKQQGDEVMGAATQGRGGPAVTGGCPGHRIARPYRPPHSVAPPARRHPAFPTSPNSGSASAASLPSASSRS